MSYPTHKWLVVCDSLFVQEQLVKKIMLLIKLRISLLLAQDLIKLHGYSYKNISAGTRFNKGSLRFIELYESNRNKIYLFWDYIAAAGTIFNLSSGMMLVKE